MSVCLSHLYLSLSVSLCASISVYLSVYLFVACQSIYLCVCLSLFLPRPPPPYLPDTLNLSACFSRSYFVCLPTSVSVCLSVYLSVCLSVCLSLSFSPAFHSLPLSLLLSSSVSQTFLYEQHRKITRNNAIITQKSTENVSPTFM